MFECINPIGRGCSCIWDFILIFVLKMCFSGFTAVKLSCASLRGFHEYGPKCTTYVSYCIVIVLFCKTDRTLRDLNVRFILLVTLRMNFSVGLKNNHLQFIFFFFLHSCFIFCVIVHEQIEANLCVSCIGIRTIPHCFIFHQC